MRLQLPPKASKNDIITLLISVRQAIDNARKLRYDMPWVTPESWERDPSSRVSFPKSKIPELKSAGVIKDPRDICYGYLFPNEYIAQMHTEFINIKALLDKICEYLESHTLRPKERIYTEFELSKFTIIEGGGQLSWIASMLEGGVV